MIKFLESPVLLCILATLAPTLAFISVNTKFFTTRQMVQSSVAAAVIGGILGTVSWFLAARLMSAGIGQAYVCALVGLATGIIFLIFSERLVTELTGSKQVRRLVIVVGLLVFTLCAYLFSPAAVSGMLILYLAFSLFDLFKKNTQQKELLIYESMTSKTKKQVFSYQLPLRPFKHKPNVYLLFLESIHSEKSAEMIYGIPPDPAMAAFYKDNRFTVYENFFSNNAMTLASMLSLLENKLSYFESEADYPPYVFDHFLQNGYKINLFDIGTFVFAKYTKWADYCSFFLPLWIKKLYGFCGPLFAQSSFLRRVVRGVDLFETEINFNHVYSSVEERLKLAEAPVFNVIRFGAGHSNHNIASYKEWEEKYIPMYCDNLGLIKRMLELIIRHDPDAVIIATGDHGAMQYMDVWRNGNVNDNIVQRGLSHELVARSFFDVLLAVRWPVFVNKPPKIYSHINVFKHIFAVLCEDKSMLSEIKADISQKNNFLVVEKGRPLGYFEHIGSKLLDYDIEEAEKNFESNKSKASQLQLAELLLRKNPSKAESILKNLLKTGSDPAAETMLSNLLFEQNRIDELVPIIQKRYWKSQDVDDCLKYAVSLKACGKTEEAVALLVGLRSRLSTLNPLLDGALLELYLHLGQYDEGIDFWEKNYKIETAGIEPATLLYLKLLFQKKQFEKIDLCFKRIPSGAMRIWSGDIHNIGFTFINMRRQDWDAPLKADLSRNIADLPDGGWGDLVQYYCLEKKRDIAGVVQQILELLGNNAYNLKALGEYLGKLLIRNNIRLPELDVFKKNALALVQERFLMYKTCGIFDESWYKEKYLLEGVGMKMNPIMHYQYYGMYEGAFPNKYFDPYHYIESVRNVFQHGLDPLEHYLHNGSQNLVDPSPTFCARRYMYEHKIPVGGKNPLVHLMSQKNV